MLSAKEHSHGSVRRLRWWSDPTLKTIASKVEECLRPWATAWGIEVPAIAAFNASSAPLSAPEAAGSPGLEAGGSHGTESHQSPAGLRHALFAEEPRSGSLAEALADAAWQALREALEPVLGSSASALLGTSGMQSDLLRSSLQAWSGAVRVRLRWPTHGGCVWLHLESTLVERLSSGSTVNGTVTSAAVQPLTPLTVAVQGRTVPLRIGLRGVELTLGTLQSLQVGDVLRLPHRLDEPLSVHAAGSSAAEGVRPMCEAYLGLKDGHPAVELLKQ